MIGALLSAADVFPAVRLHVKASDFYFYAYQRIFSAIEYLTDIDKPINTATVYERLTELRQLADVGGVNALTTLWEADPTGANATYNAQIVRRSAISRETIHRLTPLVRDAYAGAPPDQLIASLAKEASELSARVEEASGTPKFPFVGTLEFLTTDYRQEFLIKRALVRGQPGVMAGPPKTLKTSIAIDMAISLASATPFLGTFEVPRRVKTAVVSGESGKATTQETVKRQLRSRCVDDSFHGWLEFCFDLPRFTDLANMMEFARTLKAKKAEVVFIDPVYLSMGGEVDHANMFQMGAAFKVVADVLLKVGVTPILIHHSTKGLKPGKAMQLADMAYSGLAEFARQFILINRQSDYRGDGVHDLIFSVGGSAGHGGLWDLHIEEGIADDNFQGRFWRVDVQAPETAKADKIANRQWGKESAARQQTQAEERRLLDAIDAIIEGTGVEAVTRNRITEYWDINHPGLPRKNLMKLLIECVMKG